MTKYLKYLKYVLRHKWFVFVAGVKVGVPLWQLVIHDWSKFTPSEFGPYARQFYGPKLEAAYGDARNQGGLSPIECELAMQQRRETFDYAWLSHQHRNPHHYQHWVLREDSGATKTLYMPINYALEMVADWMGAGRAITGKWEVQAWYYKNRENILLHPSTRHIVELTISRVSKKAA